MGAMKNEILTACYQLVAAAVNGTYQGILITVLVAAGLRMLRRTNAATRHAVWFGTLLLLAAIIPAHFLRSRWDEGRVEIPVSAALQPDANDMGMEADSFPPLYVSESELNEHGAPTELFDAADGRKSEYVRGHTDVAAGTGSDVQTAAGGGSNVQASEDPVRALVDAIREGAASNQADPTSGAEPGFLWSIKEKLSWLGQRAVTPLPSWKITAKTPFFVAALIPMIWLGVAGTNLAFLGWQLIRIRRLKLGSAEANPELNARFLSLRESLGVRRNVTLRMSTACRSPLVLGFFKPVILLPADADLVASEYVLRHELAHVRRGDDWANLIQRSIKALFFYHPAIWWVSRRISLEREIACDDQVLQSTMRPRTYALLLADLAGRMQASVLAPGVSTNQSQLKQRIDMILNTKRNTSPRLAKARLGLIATFAALVAALAIYLAPRLAFAQSADAAPAAGLAIDAPSATISAAPSAEIATTAEVAPPPPSSVSFGLPGAAPVPAGPKFKSGSSISVDVRPAITPRPSVAIITAPAPAWSPTPSMTILTPPVAAAPMIASSDRLPEPGQPMPPRAGRRPGKESSLEERLDRLEKMVESLVAQQKGKPGQPDFYAKPQGEMRLKNYSQIGPQWEQAQADYAKKMAEYDLKRADADKRLAELEKFKKLDGPKFSKEMKELAEQHSKMAVDQAKVAEQAARESQRAARDMQRGQTIRRRAGSQQELESLHRQREALGKQMEKLDRQIEKLERGHFEEQQESDEQDVDIQENENESSDGQHSDSNKNFSPGQPAAK